MRALERRSRWLMPTRRVGELGKQVSGSYGADIGTSLTSSPRPSSTPADVKERHRRPFSLRLHQLVPFQLAMFVPDLVVAVALEFQRFGLENVPYAQTGPTFDPQSLWRIPDNINVMALEPTVRTIRFRDAKILNSRRAGNRGKANWKKTTLVSA